MNAIAFRRCGTHKRNREFTWTPGGTCPTGFVRGHWHEGERCFKWDGIRRDGQGRIVVDIFRCDQPECGRPLGHFTVRARTTSRECDARCMEADGARCECACGGRNHGKEA